MTDAKITVDLDSANGPKVTAPVSCEAEEILAALPAGWTVADDDWGNGVPVSGGMAYPLSLTLVLSSVSGTNPDGSSWTLSIGDRVAVEADECDEDSADEGRISRFESSEIAVVYWDSCVETKIDVERLTSL